MDSRGTDSIEELPVADTPEDVAVLYSWANLHGAKYRDFSASRREYRAQLRHRVASDGDMVPDHCKWPDGRVFADSSRRGHRGQRVNAGSGSGRLIEQFQGAREIQIGIF